MVMMVVMSGTFFTVVMMFGMLFRMVVLGASVAVMVVMSGVFFTVMVMMSGTSLSVMMVMFRSVFRFVFHISRLPRVFPQQVSY